MFEIELIPDKEWRSHCMLAGVSPINAGYASGETLFIKASVMGAALNNAGWERSLIVHEVHHFMGMCGHPHNVAKYAWSIKQPVKLIKYMFLGVMEAVRYGFDERAFTRFLRWKKSSKYGEYWSLAKKVVEIDTQ